MDFHNYSWLSVSLLCRDLPVVFGIRVPWFPEYDGVATLISAKLTPFYDYPAEQVPRFVRRITDKIESPLILCREASGDAKTSRRVGEPTGIGHIGVHRLHAQSSPLYCAMVKI
jgi:hypothetical protein